MLRNYAQVEIGGRAIGIDQPLFVIAEIGLNHGGSLERALEMVDQAAAAGVSAIKLQTLEAEKLVAAECPPPAHVASSSMTEFFRGFELDETAHARIAERARARGLALVATPLSLESVDMLLRVGVDAFKIASGDLTWDGLIDRVARTGKPIIISTGMATLEEVSQAIAAARLSGADSIALLHCVSAYPVPRGSENLRAIETLARSYETPVGLSDHGDDAFAVPIAVALGASLYERHMMLAGGDAIDAPVSSTPEEFASIVATAARSAAALGSGEKRCEPAEAPNVVASRRSLYAARNLPCGAVLTQDDLVALRPGVGFQANQVERLIGAQLKRDVPAGQAVTLHHIAARSRRTA
jgi:sialic acid synthase SpsE